MPNVDQFESVFKGAAKQVYTHQSLRVGKVAVVTDQADGDGSIDALQARADDLIAHIAVDASWQMIGDADYDSVGSLLKAIEATQSDLIVTYRNLKTIDWKWHNTLGGFVDVLVQATPSPVLLLPHPLEYPDLKPERAQDVMALTDHMTGDDRLVNWAAAVTQPGGKLFLTHVEDAAVLDRLLDAISKIPAIDTDIARQEIPNQLLKEPRDYIESCKAVLAEHDAQLRVESIVTSSGHRLSEYQRLIDEHEIDLLVMNTKDEDQLAMHGLSYPLTVEIRRTPMLLL